MFGIKVRAHGPTGGPAAQYAPGIDIGPALLPVPAMAAGAWSSRGQIHGAPGTQRVPAPAPFPVLDQSPVAQANEGFIGLPSSDFGYWCPPRYWQTDIPATIAVQTINQTHELPVPAIRPWAQGVIKAANNPGGISPADGAFAARIGGRWPIGWPRVIVNYPETRGLAGRYG